MPAQSQLAKLGMRIGTLGSIASLAFAAPLAEGNLSQDAHTDAARIGVYFDREVGGAGIGLVSMGVRRAFIGEHGVTTSRSATIGDDKSEFYGYDAGNAATGIGNTALGWHALQTSIVGSYQVAIGAESLANATGNACVAIGYKAGASVTTAGATQNAGSFTTNRSYVIVSIGTTDFTLIGAASNTVGLHFVASGPGTGTGTAAITSGACVAIGYRALASSTTGFGIAIGPNALSSVTTAQGIAIGRDALRACTGDSNIGIGASALRSLTTGVSNTAIGGGTLFACTAGRWNVAIGEAAVLGAITGLQDDSAYNIAIGWGAGANATTANGNIILGVQAGNVASTMRGNIILGAGAGNNLGSSFSNTLAIGGNIAGVADSRISTIVIDYDATARPDGPLVTNKMAFSEVVTFQDEIVLQATRLSAASNGGGQTALVMQPTVANDFMTLRLAPNGAAAVSSFEFFASSNISDSGRFLGVVNAGKCVLAGDKTGSAPVLPMVFRSGPFWDLADDAIVIGIGGQVAFNRPSTGFAGAVATPTYPWQIGDIGSERMVVFSDGGIQFGGTYTTPGAGRVSFGNDILVNGMTVGLGAGASIFNVAFGYNALASNTYTGGVIAIGRATLQNAIDASQAVAIGTNAMVETTTGTGSTAVGFGALRGLATSHGNTAIGRFSGDSGGGWALSNCTFIGASTYSLTNGITNSMSLGYNSQVTASNQVVVGNGNITQTILRGTVTTDASSSSRAGITLPHGVVPTAPVDGDLWSTSLGFFGRVSGVTVGPFGAGGGGGTPAGSNTEVQFNNSGAFGASPSLTWDGSLLTATGMYASGITADSALYIGLGTDRATIVTETNGMRFTNLDTNPADVNNAAFLFDLTNNLPIARFFGMVQIDAQALPSTPVAGYISIDSGDSNKLKWYDGSAWQNAGGAATPPAGSNQQIQYNDGGIFGASSQFGYDSTNQQLQLNHVIPGVAASAQPSISVSSTRTIGASGNADQAGIETAVEASGGFAGGISAVYGGILSATSSITAATSMAIIGMRSWARHDGSGSVAEVTGARVNVTTTNTAASTLASYGLRIVSSNGSDTTSAYGMHVSMTGGVAGTAIANRYGVYVENAGTPSISGTDYGIYQASAAATNQFLGLVSVAGALRQKIITSGANATLTRSQVAVKQTASGITTTLWASPITGDTINIRNASGGGNTVSGNGTNIEGAASHSIDDGEAFTLIYDGSQWTLF